jgi:hypothetical protein
LLSADPFALLDLGAVGAATAEDEVASVVAGAGLFAGLLK